MLTSRTLRTTAAAAALVLSLAACGASQEEDPAAGGEGVEATESAQDDSTDGSADANSEAAGSDGSDSEDDSEKPADDSDKPSDDDSAAGQGTDALTITLNGDETSFTPEIVRCNGEPGTIRNAVITMKNDELPLVKVTPGEFAMVKLDQRGEPEKSSSTKNITAEDGEIVFDSATIGSATVDGTVTCLQGNQD